MSLGIIPRDWIRDDGQFLLNGETIPSYGCYLQANGMTVEAATPTTSYRDVPGMHGSYDVSFTDILDRAFLPRRTVSMAIGAVGTEMDFVETQRLIGELNGAEITMRDLRQPGYWTGRATVDAWDITRNVNGCFVKGETTVSIDAQPYMIADPETVTLTAGVETTVEIKGNMPTAPVFSITPVNGSTGVVSLQCKDESRETYDRVLSLVPTTGTWGDITLTVNMATGEVYSTNTYSGVDMSTDFWNLGTGRQTILVTNANGSMDWEAHYTV